VVRGWENTKQLHLSRFICSLSSLEKFFASSQKSSIFTDLYKGILNSMMVAERMDDKEDADFAVAA
jgi:hypothetical protein